MFSNVSTNRLFIAWTIFIYAIFLAGFILFPQSRVSEANFFESFKNWDSGHFLGIAEYGYTEKFQYAFFPVYPLLVKILNLFLNSYLVSSLLISAISTYFSVKIFHKLLKFDFPKLNATKVIVLILLFPTSFYLLISYSEALFLLLTLGTFYFVRKSTAHFARVNKSKKNLLIATILATLASATRLIGVALVLALWHEAFKKGVNKNNWFVLFAPAGLIFYCLYLFQQTGDPFYFLKAEASWLRSFTFPGEGIWRSLMGVFSGSLNDKNYLINLLDLLFAVFGIGLVLRSFRFLPKMYVLYCVFSIIIPLVTPSLTSFPRFLLVIFPIFILVEMWRNKTLKAVYLIISVLLLIWFSIRYINGLWVS